MRTPEIVGYLWQRAQDLERSGLAKASGDGRIRRLAKGRLERLEFSDKVKDLSQQNADLGQPIADLDQKITDNPNIDVSSERDALNTLIEAATDALDNVNIKDTNYRDSQLATANTRHTKLTDAITALDTKLNEAIQEQADTAQARAQHNLESNSIHFNGVDIPCRESDNGDTIIDMTGLSQEEIATVVTRINEEITIDTAALSNGTLALIRDAEKIMHPPIANEDTDVALKTILTTIATLRVQANIPTTIAREILLTGADGEPKLIDSSIPDLQAMLALQGDNQAATNALNLIIEQKRRDRESEDATAPAGVDASSRRTHTIVSSLDTSSKEAAEIGADLCEVYNLDLSQIHSDPEIATKTHTELGNLVRDIRAANEDTIQGLLTDLETEITEQIAFRTYSARVGALRLPEPPAAAEAAESTEADALTQFKAKLTEIVDRQGEIPSLPDQALLAAIGKEAASEFITEEGHATKLASLIDDEKLQSQFASLGREILNLNQGESTDALQQVEFLSSITRKIQIRLPEALDSVSRQNANIESSISIDDVIAKLEADDNKLALEALLSSDETTTTAQEIGDTFTGVAQFEALQFFDTLDNRDDGLNTDTVKTAISTDGGSHKLYGDATGAQLLEFLIDKAVTLPTEAAS